MNTPTLYIRVLPLLVVLKTVIGQKIDACGKVSRFLPNASNGQPMGFDTLKQTERSLHFTTGSFLRDNSDFFFAYTLRPELEVRPAGLHLRPAQA